MKNLQIKLRNIYSKMVCYLYKQNTPAADTIQNSPLGFDATLGELELAYVTKKPNHGNFPWR